MINIKNLEAKIYDADIDNFLGPLKNYLSSRIDIKNPEKAFDKRLHNFKIICSNYELSMNMFNQYFKFEYSWPPEKYNDIADDFNSITRIFPNCLAQCFPHLKDNFKEICLGGIQIKGHMYLIIGIKAKYAGWINDSGKIVYIFKLVNPKHFKDCLNMKYISF